MENYGQPKDDKLSPGERLFEAERKYAVIVDRLKIYDKSVDHLLDKLKIVEQKITQVGKDHDDSRISCSETAQNFKESSELLSFKISELFNFYQGLERVVKRIDTSVTHTEASSISNHFALSKSLKDVEKKVSDINESFVHRKDVEAHNLHVNSSLDLLKFESKNCADGLNRLDKTVNSCNESQKSHQDTSSLRLSEHAKILSSLSDRFSSLDAKMSALSSSISTIVHENTVQLEAAKTKIRDDLIGNPASLASIQKELTGRFESAVLDAKNSLLKANNCTKQIELLERKLENVTLLLKKYELSK